jgi:regulatory protein PHO2
MDESSTKRTRASGEVLDYLLSEFERNHNPSPEQRKEMSERTGMNEKAVRIWFQNRRAKVRKFEKISKSSSSSRSNSLNTGLTNPNLNFTNLNSLNKANSDIPIDINEFYGFIDCSSLSVGSWQRIKSGHHDSHSLQNNLIKLSPFSLNSVMNKVDLLVILSKKNAEINYFFSAIANNSKILFRIFYPMSSILTCSLLDNNITKGNSELRLSLSHSPKFSVYFFNGVHANSNQWSICEDFSEGQQVSQAYMTETGTCTPHVLVGVKNSLQYLNAYISENNQILQHQQQNLTPPDSDLGVPKYNHQSQIDLSDNHRPAGSFQFTTDQVGMWENNSLHQSDTPNGHSGVGATSTSPKPTLSPVLAMQTGLSPERLESYHDNQSDTSHSINFKQDKPDDDTYHIFNQPDTPEFFSTINGGGAGRGGEGDTPVVSEKLSGGFTTSDTPSLVKLGSRTSVDDGTYTHMNGHHNDENIDMMAGDEFLVPDSNEFF